MRHKLLLLYSWLVRSLLFFFPDMPTIMRFRGWLYGLGMQSCGKDFQVTHDARLLTLQKISVGNNCFVGNFSLIYASLQGEIKLSDEVQIGPHCIVISNNHTRLGSSFRYGPSDCGSISIGFGSWIGANSTVLKDSELPSGSVLGANSLLNRIYKQNNSLYAGTPAKFIKTL